MEAAGPDDSWVDIGSPDVPASQADVPAPVPVSPCSVNPGSISGPSVPVARAAGGMPAAMKEDVRIVQEGPFETIEERIERVRNDLSDLDAFYNIALSPTRWSKLDAYCAAELDSLNLVDFDTLTQEPRVDYLLLKHFLRRRRQHLRLDRETAARTALLMPFAPAIVRLCEARQQMVSQKPANVASELVEISKRVEKTHREVEREHLGGDLTRSDAARAASSLIALQGHLNEFFSFFAGYDPLFDYWVQAPGTATVEALHRLTATVQDRLVGIGACTDGADDIIGEPIGETALLKELQSELIPYSPAELVRIAEREWEWCEEEMKKASAEMGSGDDWMAALETVKEQHVEPGRSQQTDLVRDLAREAVDYVRRHGLVTVPDLAADTWRMFMLPPEWQRTAPFFLGGPSILVAYPTASMSHEDKLMVLRGNNAHFSRATVFHELVPGHRLQLFMSDRHRPYRKVFGTPFFVEGWATYWEMVFWDRRDFFVKPEDRVGSLFWRMHRCARIIFSLSFHLGRMSARECVEMLVTRVGHERKTAEAEVRRSLSGEYAPLYQAAYMLGALQLRALKKEVLLNGDCVERQFHDRVLRAGAMPVELLRALVLGSKLTKDFETSWRFYGDAD